MSIIAQLWPGAVTSIYDQVFSIPADEFGRPNLNPPTVVDQDNVTLYRFTLNADRMTFKFPVPYDYNSGDLNFWFVWTNDGGTDDNGRAVKWQMDYQLTAEGEAVSGSAPNSPRVVEDVYTSTTGWIEHHSDRIRIPSTEFAGKFCIYMKISAVTPVGAALTCEPHLLGLCFEYESKIDSR